MTRIVIGMSGGVDSSLAASLLREQGHDVIGVTMKLWPCAEIDGGFTRADACCSPGETIDARAVAVGAGVPHYVVDCEDEFQASVVDRFIAGYAAGETPNPCVRCNESIKFGALWDYADRLGAERVATGHYARVGTAFDRWLLRTAVDRAKDQTNFLFSLTQAQLARAEFPVGGMTKAEVREAAGARAISTAQKAESMDLCFTGRDGVEGFLRRKLPQAFVPGPIMHIDGTVLGEHQGLGAVTVGQRKGLGVAWTEPLFVVKRDVAANTVVMGPRAALMVDTLHLRECTWHVAAPTAAGLTCRVRLRHHGTPVPATIFPTETGARVHLHQPQQRTGAGQACVAYDDAGEWCLGGGWIGPGRAGGTADSASVPIGAHVTGA